MISMKDSGEISKTDRLNLFNLLATGVGGHVTAFELKSRPCFGGQLIDVELQLRVSLGHTEDTISARFWVAMYQGRIAIRQKRDDAREAMLDLYQEERR